MKTLTILGWRFTIERRAGVRMCLDAVQESRVLLKGAIGMASPLPPAVLMRRECLLVWRHRVPHAYGEWQLL